MRDPDPSVPVLSDNAFGALLRRRAMQQEHHIGVVLEFSGLSKRGEIRPTIFAADRARERRQTEDRYPRLHREGLQGLTDGFNLEPAFSDLSRRMDELQVVHDHERQGRGLVPLGHEVHDLPGADGIVGEPDRKFAQPINMRRDHEPVAGAE